MVSVGPINALALLCAFLAFLIGALLMLGVLAAGALIDGIANVLLGVALILAIVGHART